MKKLFAIKMFVLLMLLNISGKGQDRNTFAFSYDAAGNVIQRQLQIMPPLPGGRLGKFEKDSIETIPPVSFKIYPNPAQTFVTIEGELPVNCTEAKVQLLNSNGQILKTTTYNSEIKTIDVSDLKNGMYLLEIIYNKKQKSTYKIIVTN